MNNKQKQFILLTAVLFIIILIVVNIHTYIDSSRFITGASRTSQVLSVNRLRRPSITKPSEHHHYPDLRKQEKLHLVAVPGMKRVYVLSADRVIYIMHARVNIAHRSALSQGDSGQQVNYVTADHNLSAHNWTALDHRCYIIAPNAIDQQRIKRDWLKIPFAFPNTIQLSRPDAQWMQTLPKDTKITIR